jgi:hypothetical protein
MTKQERQQLLTFRAHIRCRCLACPTEVTDCLWTASGTHIDVNSPARNNRANVSASRRLVLIRSPGFRGISEGATTVQS